MVKTTPRDGEWERRGGKTAGGGVAVPDGGIMKTLVETTVLDNGLTMEVWDRSRPIAADTTKVELYVRVPVRLERDFFPGDEAFDVVRRIWDDPIVYEYVRERTFVGNDAREAVFAELLAAFRAHTLPYLGRPDFARGLALARYREYLNNPHTFRNRLQ
ncbi:MAG TPA: hypothetical protein PLD71_06355 [Syntrophales bacterium]|nr:hypothetical protein [Syntrophales bacterium]HPB70311.1 hypothetical protein [Syntrophales bacterium]HQN25558.1 hypothetical protein [Syntrophales bacterium]HQP28832.1 hypothetical protein [Syntrophales bacterium]